MGFNLLGKEFWGILSNENFFFIFLIGYLAVSLFLHESHELLLLLVNTVVKVPYHIVCWLI